LITAATAAVITYAAIAAAIGWLTSRALAKPNPRSSHTVPTPQGAGIVIVPIALLVAAIALAWSGNRLPPDFTYLTVVAIAALALTAIGFIDDIRGLGVVSRLVSQVAAVGLAIMLMPSELRIVPAIPLPIERVLLIGAALWFVNLFNFMDGIDLISAIETIAVGIGVVLLALIGAVPAAYGIVAVALVGAMLAFVPWNTPVARLFLGDAGSIPIGFLLAILLIHVAANGAFAAALILPLYYLADATITLVWRFWRGERVWEAHRQHFYQQATQNGFTVIETVARIAILDAVLIGLAIFATLSGGFSAGIAVVIAAAGVAALLRSFAAGR